MRKKVQINNESIESIVKKDYKEALVEYILNAFEANATEVSVVSTLNALGGVEEIKIIDNGAGIDHSTLSQTFESFLSSTKQPLLKPISFGRNKGRGRYAFISFANSATWQTVYADNGRLLSYTIKINAITKDHVDFDEELEDVTDKNTSTGTIVTLQGISTLSVESMNFSQIEKPLLNAFASFLYLKRYKNYKITVNGTSLDYTKFIDIELSEDRTLTIDDQEFTACFVKWIYNIKSRYFFHFLDASSRERYNEHTKFNNNAIEFFHSVYIESAYFDDFVPLDDHNAPEEQLTLDGTQAKNQRAEIFKKLLKSLDEFVESKLKAFVKKDADRLVEKIESEGGFPNFGQTAFDQERKEDLVAVVKEIYCVEPRIFKGLKRAPQKSILGFLNLLLSTDERENIITIIEEITQLTPQERADLAAILQYTKLSNVIRTVKLITDRLRIIELLRLLIYDNETFATERNHIQKVISENYWLFGEEFHLVSADKNFEKALSEYLYIIDGNDDKNKYLISNQERLRRPDIFICQKRPLEYPDGSQLEQNIIVELKSPQIILDKKVHRQIEDYMDFIIKEPRFNSQLRVWRFIVVCKSVNDDIKNLYKSFEIYNKRFLTRTVDNQYEIYSMTWDDVFKSYDLRYSFLLKRLDVDQQVLLSSIESIGASRETADRLREEILQLSN